MLSPGRQREAARADGISETEFLRSWCDDNRAVYRAYDKEWNHLLKRSLRLAYRAWKRDLRWSIELLRARVRLWKDERLPPWLARL